MTSTQCCVCDREVSESSVLTLGGRTFCAEHGLRAQQANRFSWARAGFIEAALTLLYVAGVALLLGGTQLSPGGGLLLALVPSLVWMAHIYRQDRLEPEPLGFVTGVFLLAGLLTWAVSVPLTRWLLEQGPAASSNPIVSWAGEIGIEATFSVLTAYLAMRYTVYLTAELDEPMDVLVYLCAAASGVAFARNLGGVLAGGGALAGNASAIMASNVLIGVAGAMPLAVGLAWRRFLRAGNLAMAGGLLGSVIVHGALAKVVMAFGGRGERFHPVQAMVLATVLSVVVIGAAHAVTRQLRERHLQLPPGEDGGQPRRLPRLDFAVWGVAALLLGGTETYLWTQVPPVSTLVGLGGKVSVTLPRGWTGESQESSVVAGPARVDLTASQLEIAHLARENVDAELELLSLEETRRRNGYGYRVLRTEQKAAFGAAETMWSWYAMAVDPPGDRGGKALPEVVRGVDVVIPTSRLSVSLRGPAEELSEAQMVSLLSTVEVHP